MSCEESETTASRRRRRPLSPASEPLEDDDLLSEILLRLPPLPSSLPRASAVCSRWRGLVSDPRFVRRFHLRHRGSPPLLGFFDTELSHRWVTFVPALEPPNRVPTQRLSLQIGNFRLFDCRHGLVLIFQVTRNQALVWDPATSDKHVVALPAGFGTVIHGAVLRDATNIRHFKVVIVGITKQQAKQLGASVYSSETGVWGDLVSTALPNFFPNITFMPYMQPAMVRNYLYWPFAASFSGILEFDLDHQSLAVIPMPAELPKSYCQSRVTRAGDYGLGLLTVRDCTAELWKREVSCDGVVSWVLGRTIELDKLLSLNPVESKGSLLGISEENNAFFFFPFSGIFMIQLDSLHFKRIPLMTISHRYQPFECVYAAGTGTGGGHDGAELVHNK